MRGGGQVSSSLHELTSRAARHPAAVRFLHVESAALTPQGKKRQGALQRKLTKAMLHKLSLALERDTARGHDELDISMESEKKYFCFILPDPVGQFTGKEWGERLTPEDVGLNSVITIRIL